MPSIESWWAGEIDWSRPAGQFLKRFVAALPADRPFHMTVFGSAPRAWRLGPPDSSRFASSVGAARFERFQRWTRPISRGISRVEFFTWIHKAGLKFVRNLPELVRPL